MKKEKPLHPIQIQILKVLYNQRLTVYALGKALNLPTSLVRYHVKYLEEKNLVKKMKRMDNAFLYYTNREVVEVKREREKDIIIIKFTV